VGNTDDMRVFGEQRRKTRQQLLLRQDVKMIENAMPFPVFWHHPKESPKPIAQNSPKVHLLGWIAPDGAFVAKRQICAFPNAA
jgi:hypothetical protein